ncbi:MAG: hypothetical protein V7739_22090 [Motiliproteus sp.]
MANSSDHRDSFLTLIAYHEAGHAVVAHYYQRKVFDIRISDQENGDNWVVPAPCPPVGNRADGVTDLRTVWPIVVEETLVTCAIAAAGIAAESLYLRIPMTKFSGGEDYEIILRQIKELEFIRKNTPALKGVDTNYQKGALSEILLRPCKVFNKENTWRYVERIVGALLVKNKLHQTEVERLLTGMAVDGKQAPSELPPLNFQFDLEL